MLVEMRITGIDGVLDLLKKLPPSVVSKRGGPVRAALRKGALKISKPAKANLRRSAAGEDNTGLLLSSLVVSRGKPPTDGRGERYLVRIKRQNYKRKGQTVTTLKTANLLEYGSSQQPAEPWLRPAFLSNAQAAIDETIRSLLDAINKIVNRS